MKKLHVTKQNVIAMCCCCCQTVYLKIAPEESIEVLEKALKLCPEITVAGIAGPGDTLATDYALQTFRLIKEKFPDLIKCMSTNGLLLLKSQKK